MLPNPVMTASGTAGHGAELAGYFDLSALGAVVVKSLSAEPYDGNASPRVHEAAAGMLNSVGLQNPGVEHWLEHELPALHSTGARVVASIWGFTVEAYEKAATMLRGADIVAVEVNLSCPNIESRRDMFAHSSEGSAAVVSATRSVIDRPLWAKLSPNVTDLIEIASAATDAGADALTLVNTVMGMAVDPHTRRYRLGSGSRGGGLSGAAIHPVAVRAVHDVRQALPNVAIVGVGGVADADDAIELMLVGANAVQVGTATFQNPRAAKRVVDGLAAYCRRHSLSRLTDLIGAVHDDAH